MEPIPLPISAPDPGEQPDPIITLHPPHDAPRNTQTLGDAGSDPASRVHPVQRLLPDPFDVSALAYRYYCERGCLDGHDLEDWLRAEQELTTRTHLLEPAK